MNTALKISLAALSLAAAGMPARATGSAELSFLQPERFTDVGFGHVDRERTLQSLMQFFDTLGKRLPEGQTLRVEVLDIDLAGEVWPRGPYELRVLRGRADWPQLTLRYALLEDSRTMKAGEARLADMNYFFDQHRLSQYGDLPFEKRMLDRWFKEAIAPTPP